MPPGPFMRLEYIIAFGASVILLVLLSVSCSQTKSPPLNSNQVLVDIKAQTGITLSTNAKVLEADDGESREPGFYEWTLYVKSPEKIPIPQSGALTNAMKNDRTAADSVKEVERHIGTRIVNPLSTVFSIWETSAGQCQGLLIQTSDGEYLHLRRFLNTVVAPTNGSKG
jgi:hypothetical protein